MTLLAKHAKFIIFCHHAKKFIYHIFHKLLSQNFVSKFLSLVAAIMKYHLRSHAVSAKYVSLPGMSDVCLMFTSCNFTMDYIASSDKCLTFHHGISHTLPTWLQNSSWPQFLSRVRNPYHMSSLGSRLLWTQKVGSILWSDNGYNLQLASLAHLQLTRSLKNWQPGRQLIHLWSKVNRSKMNRIRQFSNIRRSNSFGQQNKQKQMGVAFNGNGKYQYMPENSISLVITVITHHWRSCCWQSEGSTTLQLSVKSTCVHSYAKDRQWSRTKNDTTTSANDFTSTNKLTVLNKIDIFQ